MERYLREHEPQIKNEPFDFVDSVDIIQDSWIKAEIKEEDLFQVFRLFKPKFCNAKPKFIFSLILYNNPPSIAKLVPVSLSRFI